LANDGPLAAGKRCESQPARETGLTIAMALAHARVPSRDAQMGCSVVAKVVVQPAVGLYVRY
jgi:hypothetical protein